MTAAHGADTASRISETAVREAAAFHTIVPARIRPTETALTMTVARPRVSLAQIASRSSPHEYRFAAVQPRPPNSAIGISNTAYHIGVVVTRLAGNGASGSLNAVVTAGPITSGRM